jgi:hypothetical protein
MKAKAPKDVPAEAVRTGSHHSSGASGSDIEKTTKGPSAPETVRVHEIGA